MCCDASIVVTVFNSYLLCFLFYYLCCDASKKLPILLTVLLCVIKSSIGTQGEVGRLQKCFKPPVIYSTDRSKAVVPVLVLLFVALVYSTRRFVSSLALCYFVIVLFSPFIIAITSLGEERANLSVFSYVCLICACSVSSVSSSSWCLGWTAACDCSTPWTDFFSFLFC